ncbi:NAD-dependent epimerase/dehydratase family protein [Larkinella terrae]|uniref:NAD-dependent epimerase/dehydratase family protein n=1 Tax=Larkinella terrae TaxID=2025311 RepID=A0A7K0EQS3_9BACT|nr:NAD-dependent epimerase/dehydratase family protein [Larkinella terrae]MRS63856.1 NAD-dependent epimerase/dehydratase family protein [Larkinella terrae]
MKVLLTGATGLLGVHLAGELLNQGYEVKAVYRSFPAQINKLPWFKDVDWTKAAITEPADVRRTMKDCQAVIHAAARTDPYPTSLSAYYDANIASTEHMLAAVRKWDVQRLVYVSTASVFRPGTLENPATEESPYAFHLMDSGYIASKYEAQQRVLMAVDQGVNAVVVNPAFMLGPYDFKPSSGAVIRYAMQNRLLIYPGSGGKSFIDVRDAARATVNALRLGRAGGSYLLANENLPYDRFFQRLARISGKKKTMLPLPKSLIRFAGTMASVGERVLRKPLPINAINARLLTQDNYYSGEKARLELRMPTASLSKAIEEAMEWFSMADFYSPNDLKKPSR